MSVDMELLGPETPEEEVTFAVEALVFSVQIALQRAMNRLGVSNKELAEKLGMSPARVAQIFSSKGPNLTLRTIAKVAHALGEDFELTRKQENHSQLSEFYLVDFSHADWGSEPEVWKETRASNTNHVKRKMAA